MATSTQNSLSQDAINYRDGRPDEAQFDEILKDVEETLARQDAAAKAEKSLETSALAGSRDHKVKARARVTTLPASIVSAKIASSRLSDVDIEILLEVLDDEKEHAASRSHPSHAKTVKRSVSDRDHYASRNSLVELRNGWLFANHIGYPLNTMVTIVWRSAEGFVAKAWADNKKVEDDVFHSLQTFLGERNLPLAYIYAMENLEVGGWGPHTHMLLHLPADQLKALMKKLQHRLMKAGGFGEENAVHIQASDPANQEGGLRYICKGASPFDIVTYRGKPTYLGDLPSFQHPLEPQGRVPRRKRAGTSHLLGKKARRLVGWKEVDDLLWLSETATVHEIWYRVRPKLRWSTDARKLAAETHPLIH
jgi:hypothetical protein